MRRFEEGIRRELRYPSGAWRVDETYVRGAYLYRAVDSARETIEFMPSTRDLLAAKVFLRLNGCQVYLAWVQAYASN
jgi:transposase-like protein